MLEYEPAAQGMHVELLFAPTASECVPLAHGLHVEEPLAEKVPAGQRLHKVGPSGVPLALQVAVKPSHPLQQSDVKRTLMYPVEDVYFVLGLTDPRWPT